MQAKKRAILLLVCTVLLSVIGNPCRAQSVTDADGKRVFLRGVGWSPWHATYGWNLTPEAAAADQALLRALHVNALRTWGPTSGAGADALRAQGFYLLPQLGGVALPRSRYRDGKPAAMPVFTAPESLAAMRDAGRQLAKACRGHRGVIALNLGNEYSCTGRDGGGNYVYAGFDAATLAAFHAYLVRRFGSVPRLNQAFGTHFDSFAAVMPGNNVAKDALFYEWWLFLRESTAAFLHAGAAGIRAVDPRIPITYARLCGNRWDPITEDAVLSFLPLQGDNLYFHWDNDWGGYCTRLDRIIGPERPVILTEAGIDTYRHAQPGEAARLIRQMLWLSVLHPEVAGIFPFEFSDEWHKAGDPKRQDPNPEEYWGLVPADRKRKSTFTAVAETYTAFTRWNNFLTTRQAPPAVLVTDQSVDWWHGGNGVTDHAAISRVLYRRGVSFRLVSLLDPEALARTSCRRLILTDAVIPDDPDGESPALQAILAFAARGGQVLVLPAQPWQGIYRRGGIPAALRHTSGVVRWGKGCFILNPAASRDPEKLWLALRPFLPAMDVQFFAKEGEEVFWRVLRGGGERMLLAVNTGRDPIVSLRLHLPGAPKLAASDGAHLEKAGKAWRLRALQSFALIRLGGN